MLTNAQKAVLVMKALTEKMKIASNSLRSAEIEHAQERAAFDKYKEMEDREGIIGFSNNPYKPEYTQKKKEEAMSVYLQWESVHEYAEEVFLKKIE